MFIKDELMVVIRCLAYNHEPYIRQCLDGFVMQKTNFRFEAIVHDDASTDGTASIIREYAEKYPDIIKPIYETENQYSKRDGSLSRIMNAHMHGRYIAICEGDDYWTDPYKLQKQVDFMEANPEYSMCYTNIDRYNQKTKVFDEWILSDSNVITVDDLMIFNRVHTLTVLLRKELLLEYSVKKPQVLENLPMGDYPMWLWMSLQGPIYHFKDKMGVYRVLENSASHIKDKFKKYKFFLAGYNLRLYFNKEYKLGYYDLWFRRLKFVVVSCIKNGWYKEMLNDILRWK
ncbi:MAG: glycosyltransferase [Paludibacteraceae bacterium]|nr:glycosyltransferase [Paludibacteraceae bacterium]